MADKKHEIDKDVSEAVAGMPVESAGGGQYQNDWAQTPEGQEYLSKAKERADAEKAQAKAYADGVKNTTPEPAKTKFAESGDGDEGSGDSSDTGSAPDTSGDASNASGAKPAPKAAPKK